MCFAPRYMKGMIATPSLDWTKLASCFETLCAAAGLATRNAAIRIAMARNNAVRFSMLRISKFIMRDFHAPLSRAAASTTARSVHGKTGREDCADYGREQRHRAGHRETVRGRGRLRLYHRAEAGEPGRSGERDW